MKKLLVTTPIYYANGSPHLGHAYSTVVADVVARFARMAGFEVKFSTGMDEHGQKIERKAAEMGLPVQNFLDELAEEWQGARKKLGISHTDFVRTTDEKHKKFVEKMLVNAKENGFLVQKKYAWKYCVGCESFKMEKDLIEGAGGVKVCPDHPTLVLEEIEEENWFFELSKFQDFLEEFFRENPDFVEPHHKFREVQSFVGQCLEDFSISRAGIGHGIPLPRDENAVTYVWFDALFNYVSVDPKFRNDADQIVHVLGKDIVRFHAVYWPAMLDAVGQRKPMKELVTGHFTADGIKMGKSNGNVVDPFAIAQKYGRDALVSFFVGGVTLGFDGDFSMERFHDLYHARLVNGRGNLVQRIVKLAAKAGIENVDVSENDVKEFHRFLEEKWKKESVPGVEGHFEKLGLEIDFSEIARPAHFVDFFARDSFEAEKFAGKFLFSGSSDFGASDFSQFFSWWMTVVSRVNEFVHEREPWVKLKNPETAAEGKKDLEIVLWVIKNLALLSAPRLVEGFEKLKNILGIEELKNVSTVETQNPEFVRELLEMKRFSVNLQPEILYPRVAREEE